MLKITNAGETIIKLIGINNCIYFLAPNEEAEVETNQDGLFTSIRITKRNEVKTEPVLRMTVTK